MTDKARRRLTDADVLTIQTSTESAASLSERFDVSRRYIYKLRAGKQVPWRRVVGRIHPDDAEAAEYPQPVCGRYRPAQPRKDHPMNDRVTRRPFPLGKLRKPRVVTVRPANRPPLVMLNRYPGQVIGVQFRLPQLLGPADAPPVHLALGIVWASPSRWWR